MTADLRRLDALMQSMQRLGIGELDFRSGEEHYNLVRQKSSSSGKYSGDVKEKPVETVMPLVKSLDERIIAASMHGIFYRASSPDLPPFVKEGDFVREGQTLYILEVMKTLTPIGSDVSGVIKKILAQDAQSVEPGTELFSLELRDA